MSGLPDSEFCLPNYDTPFICEYLGLCPITIQKRHGLDHAAFLKYQDVIQLYIIFSLFFINLLYTFQRLDVTDGLQVDGAAGELYQQLYYLVVFLAFVQLDVFNIHPLAFQNAADLAHQTADIISLYYEGPVSAPSANRISAFFNMINVRKMKTVAATAPS
jgi:hypothetical protein